MEVQNAGANRSIADDEDAVFRASPIDPDRDAVEAVVLLPADVVQRDIDEDDDSTLGAHPDKRPNRAPSRAPVDLTIALQAVQSAIEGLREIKPGLLRHQLDQALMDVFAHLGLATRAIEQEMRRVKRGGK